LKCDPILDNLSEEKKKKLEHLEMLEQKGFEVTELKQAILKEVDNTLDLYKS
jgi:hypothetical protein